MQVLILDDDPSFQAQLAQAMLGHGFNVLCVDTVPGAEAFLRLGMVDVLIAAERIGGKLSHAVALLAECRNPLLAAVLRTDRTGGDLDELFDLVPSVVGILGREVAPSLVMQVVLAATSGVRSSSVTHLLASRWAAAERPADAAEDAADESVSDFGTVADLTAPDTSPDTAPDSADDHAGIFAPAGAGVLSPAARATQPADGSAVPAFHAQVPFAATPGLPGAAAANRPLAFAARAWDGLWTAKVSALPADATTPAAATAPAAAGQGGTATLPGPASTIAPRPLAASPAGAARSLRPSPDSPLARVMAAGSRALGRPSDPAADAVTDALVTTTPRPRGTALPAWIGAPSAAGRVHPRPEAGHAAGPAGAAAPAGRAPARPAHVPERRLHLA
jgi:hypothetical protein